MFSSHSSEAVGFKSCDSSSKISADSQTQTSDVKFEERRVQVITSKENEVQAEFDVLKEIQAPKYDETKLNSFLQRVCPSIVKELDKVQKSKAFSNYSVSFNDWPEHVSEVCELKSDPFLKLDDCKTSCLSWSCSGNTIVVGYSAVYHPALCSHRSAVHFYNIQGLNFEGNPHKVVETNSCVTCLAPHPYEPALVAVGFYSGEVSIWNLQKNDSEMYFEKSTHHTDKVTRMEWVNLHSSYHLISSSLDGYMSLFRISMAMKSVTLAERYMLNDFTHSLLPGVTTFGVSLNQVGVFVAGLEGGELLHCSVNLAILNSRPSSATIMKNPVIKFFKKMTRMVTSISFSPYIDNIFVLTGGDQHLYLYSLNEDAPLNVITSPFEVTGACWTPSQANLFTAWGVSSALIICHQKKPSPIAELRPDVKSKPLPENIITCAAFNNKSNGLIAVGGAGGVTTVWEVPKCDNSRAD